MLGKTIRRVRKTIVTDKRLRKDLDAFRNARNVLDVGCGRGYFLKMLPERGTGIDGSLDNVNYCRSLGLKVYDVKLPGNLPFADGEFDGVYCSHLIEHFYPSDALRILKEINRVLCVGGILLIRSPLFSKTFFDDPTHIRPYPLHSVLHFLGGLEESGSRQIIFGNEVPSFILRSYYEEVIPLYTSSVAPTISPLKFPFRLLMRGITLVLTNMHVGRKGAYGAILIKTKSTCSEKDHNI